MSGHLSLPPPTSFLSRQGGACSGNNPAGIAGYCFTAFYHKTVYNYAAEKNEALDAFAPG